MANGRAVAASQQGTAYARVAGLIAAGRCALLDGGTGTELPPREHDPHALDERLWGTQALLDDPGAVLAVHRRYVDAGCDVISTNTWGLPSALLEDGPRLWDTTRPVHWMDVARQGIRLARRAVEEGGRGGECAVAFSLNGDVDSPQGAETVRLLARVFADEPPDLVLVETIAIVRPSLDATIERLLATGLPLWLSFRRCRHGLCGVYGEHWGGPEGDGFGRAARRFEEQGVGALLVNCIPPDHVAGMVSYLRDFTDLPLGAYPNLGYLTNEGWRQDPGVTGGQYADMALGWREEGAQIVGGCCGVGPEHIAAARERLAGTRPGRRRAAPTEPAAGPGAAATAAQVPVSSWTDKRGRELYPLDFPDLVCDPGVFVPGAASFLAWRYLAREGIGAHQRCLDAGCGTGILTVQLALNGAAHVHAIDIDERAVANTLANAFRNGVSDRVSAAAADLLPWTPEERYEVVVASLHQQPADPFQQTSTHRPVDYWGRILLDQLLGKLGQALAPEGVAYVVQLSVLSREATDRLLAAAGLVATVVDVGLFPFPPELEGARTQIRRVEELSDAYHVQLGGHDVMAAYLLEVRHADARAQPWRPAA
ncbi:MAG TPA: homocysteine S-methyltransferase family protein [Solirubrobacteraceae bacterium]|nr:homocysteine S-methyltransferase family protein [Solirubrobacteraceae bacterium]